MWSWWRKGRIVMETVALGTILEMTKGKKPVRQSKECLNGYMPYVDIKAFETGTIDSYTDGEKCLPCKEGDILIVCDGSRSGLVGYAIRGYVGSTLAKISAKGLTNKYLFYFLQGQYRLLNTKKKGTGTPHVNPEVLNNAQLVVPSLTEQERIVARIEELFSELGKGVETLQTVQQQLKAYRQAVLKEAFDTRGSGKRTEISEIVDDIRIGPFGTMLHKSDYISGGIPVINPQHIKNNSIMPGSNVTISQEKAIELRSYRLQENDIIMGRRGELGRTAAVSKCENGWICGTGSILFRLKPEFDAVFYAQILSSPDVVHYLEDNATGTTMKNLNEKIVKHIPVPYVTRAMQDSIMEDMDMKISVCDSIEKTTDEALQQSEALRQSILKEAFEGRLLL